MIEIGKQGEWADAKSILSLLTLGAAQGTELELQATGSDAADAIKAIGELFSQGFNEMGEPVDALCTDRQIPVKLTRSHVS